MIGWVWKVFNHGETMDILIALSWLAPLLGIILIIALVLRQRHRQMRGIRNITITIHKARREGLKGISIVGLPVTQRSGSDFCIFACPLCRIPSRLPDQDFTDVIRYATKWDKEGYDLRGIFDCPTMSCQRPLILGIHKMQPIKIAAQPFYVRAPGGNTLKAARTSFDGDVWKGKE